MIRFFLTAMFVLFLTLPSNASHITGGEMSYALLSRSGNDYTYRVSLKLFSDAFGSVLLPPVAQITIFDKLTNAKIIISDVDRTANVTITLRSPNPCIVSPPIVSYKVSSYEFDVTLPGTANGYIISYQDCCRIGGIANILNSTSTGVTYCAEIPGNTPVASGLANNSAHFLGVDTVMICGGYPFSYNFGAEDFDGDSLVYSFCSAYNGGFAANEPPYATLAYNTPTYPSTAPLGSGVNINPGTGLITGNAPPAGIYVVTVCVQEYRNGVLMATQRKDLQVKVSDCEMAKVTLPKDGYNNCNDFTLSFSNLTPSSVINSYFWDFGDPATLADTSLLTASFYTYQDTGVYTVKVIANRNAPCADSATAKVRVYPGLISDFNHTGICINMPVQFNDLTSSPYGNITSWRYDFGVNSISSDTSGQKDTQYTFTATGNYTTQLIVSNDKGCRDTVSKTLSIFEKPPITLPFRDTLICNNDTLQLRANGIGRISWEPNYNIFNADSSSPLVFPQTTTWYTVEFNEQGCMNTDSLRVRVTDRVNLTAGNDTTVCANDPVQLYAKTDGLLYSWAPDPTLSNTNNLNPVATPVATTTYQITARTGGCTATTDVTLTAVPRPTVSAGDDFDICYKSSRQFNAQASGTSFLWSPPTGLDDPNSLNPVATLTTSTSYILAVTMQGCTKPSYDTITVTVLPRVNATAGNDTLIFAGLPLQLRASGGIQYQWWPATGLNNAGIAGPIAIFDWNTQDITYIVTVTDQLGCSDTASITVTVDKTGPKILVPTGFTPNDDGRNDVFRPIYVGMKTIDYFRVYNRWGSLIYTHNLNDGKGWDGTINGRKQNTGSFIWMVRATDVLGNVHFKKGTVMLIR